MINQLSLFDTNKNPENKNPEKWVVSLQGKLWDEVSQDFQECYQCDTIAVFASEKKARKRLKEIKPLFKHKTVSTVFGKAKAVDLIKVRKMTDAEWNCQHMLNGGEDLRKSS